jgi:hypothetical protein
MIRHIHKSLYFLAVKSTAKRKKRHGLFGSVSFTYTGRKKQHSSSAAEGEEKQKAFKITSSKKRGAINQSIYQSINLSINQSIYQSINQSINQHQLACSLLLIIS